MLHNQFYIGPIAIFLQTIMSAFLAAIYCCSRCLSPLVITWFFSLLAYYSFRSYVESLRKSKDWGAHKAIMYRLILASVALPSHSYLK